MAVSVIIPTINEAACIAATIRSLRAQESVEIIVVDGGSRDGTLEAAAGADRVLSAVAGRASQMNTGADHARGDIFLFLHADCGLETGWLRAVERCLKSSSTIAGCFTMRTLADGILYRCIDFCASARVRLTGIAYGDQGLFVRRKDFFRLGGFPRLRFMEDVFFSRTLRRHGQVKVIRPRIFVSPRRWQQAGLVRQTLRNWRLTTLASIGVHPDRLAQCYPTVR